jgi:hypothetical protein
MTTLPMAAAIAGPAADPTREPVTDPHRLHAGGGGRGEVTLEVDGRQLSVTRREGDHLTTTVVDMDQVGRMVGDAVGEAMVAMEDLQLQVRVGKDNRVNITTAEGEVEVDLDEIMTQVAAAVQSGLEGVDTAAWVTTGPVSAVSNEELQVELAELQEEMRALRSELRRLRDQAGSAPADGR